jgi:SAM-dependent methyltransferase
MLLSQAVSMINVLCSEEMMAAGSIPPTTVPAMPDPDRVMAVAGGFVNAKMAFVANDIGLFMALDPDGSTASEIGQRCGVPEHCARIVADVLAACGLLMRNGERYLNSPEAAAFLCGRGPLDLRPVLEYFDQVSYPGSVDALQAIRTGQGVQGDPNPKQAEAYERFVAMTTAPIAAGLPTCYDFTAHRRVLDVGGGVGTLLLPILSHNPHLTGTVVDLPDVAELARTQLAIGPVADRVEVFAADIFQDELPTGHDAILVAHLLHLFPADRNVALLAKLRAVAPPAGRLLLVDWWRDWQIPPTTAVYSSLEFLMKSGGDTYPSAEAAKWLAATGWRLIDQRPLMEPASLLVAEPA